MPDSTVELLRRAVEAQKKVLDKPKPLRERLEEDENGPAHQRIRGAG